MALQPTLNLNNADAIADVGNRIYNERYKAEYEQKYLHQFAAVDVLSGGAALGATAMEAVTKAHEMYPEGFFHLIRVGHAAAFAYGWATRRSNPGNLNVTSSRLS
jgi:hypothetical protein